jgi:KDO2-lipid IV(A) lauroyltransferase
MFYLNKSQRRFLQKILCILTPIFLPFLFILELFPISILRKMTKFFSFLWWIMPSRRKRIAMANLKMIFSEEESRRILRLAMENFVFFAFETLKLSRASPEEILKKVCLKGRENVGKIKEGGILISCHLGNFPLICFRLSLEGLRLGVVIKFPRNPFLARMVKQRGERWGVTFVEINDRYEAIFRLQKFLKEGGVLLLMLDQNPRSRGVVVPFLGLPTPTYRTPLLLAQKTRLPILPVFIYQKDGKHHLEILKPFRLSEDIFKDMETLNSIINHYVSSFPEQWWWWHRRWRNLISYR